MHPKLWPMTYAWVAKVYLYLEKLQNDSVSKGSGHNYSQK